MDFELFMLSFFQMADVWREGPVRLQAYLDFMDHMEGSLMVTNDEGDREWAWERNVMWDVQMWEIKESKVERDEGQGGGAGGARPLLHVFIHHTP